MYVTDILKAIAENKTLKERFAELILKTGKPQDNRSGEEIAMSVLSHIERMVKAN